jgi:hypothetical protein
VRDRIETVRGLLPAEVEAPIVQKFDIGALPIMNLALSGPQGVDALYELADEELRERFSRVDGVAGVQIVGGRAREVEVLVSPERLQAYGVTLPEIVNLIRPRTCRCRPGRITEAAADVPVRVVGEYRSSRDRGAAPLPAGGQVVRLGDVATVREGFEDATQVARYNGEPAVSISIQKRSDANPVTTAAGVRAEIEAHPRRAAAGHADHHRARPERVHPGFHQRRALEPADRHPPDDAGALPVPALVARHDHRRGGDAGHHHLDVPADGRGRLHAERHDADGAQHHGRHPGHEHDRRAGEHLPAPGPGRGPARARRGRARRRSPWRWPPRR